MGLPKIVLGRDVLSDVNEALDREWLVTNGLGGYASSTVLGINTRKYHGLLVASFNPPVNRWVMLTKLDEELTIVTESYALGANEFRDAMHPKGYCFLSEFVVAPLPTFRYIVGGVSLQKTVFMPYMKNATAVRQFTQVSITWVNHILMRANIGVFLSRQHERSEKNF